MGAVLKRDYKAAADAFTKAAEIGRQAASDAGLTVLVGETPTDYQARIAALHAREDTAAISAMLVQTYAQQRKILRWARGAVLLSALCLLVTCATAADRSKAARADFMRANPCPATGKARGPCPGFVVDHLQPLCAGGPDHPANMQWQTVADAKAKDREEVKQCRAKR